jgi:hypothetical protein
MSQKLHLVWYALFGGMFSPGPRFADAYAAATLKRLLPIGTLIYIFAAVSRLRRSSISATHQIETS